MTVSASELTALTDWEHGLISPKILIDQQIYEEEMEKLFGRTWLFLADDSMIPKPGDFFSTFMGTDPVLVVRQSDGSVKGLLNACRHRGMKVCRADEGNIKAFTCTYHGWTYDTSGKLVNVPNLEDGYYNELATDKWGLIEVAQVQNYKGLIFGNFDPSAPPLIEYLGDMAWYLDSRLDRREGGIEVTGSVRKIAVKGNWKLAAEQFAGDNYHAITTHVSATFNDVRAIRTVADARQFSSRHGHGITGFPLTRDPIVGQLRARGRDEFADYFERHLPEMEQRLGNRPMGGALTIFPNFQSGLSPDSAQFGVFHPKGPSNFEWWSWNVVDHAATPDEKRIKPQPNGIIDSDDAENWDLIGRNIASPQIQKMMFNYQMGLGHERDDDGIYPGLIGYRWVAEGAQRGFYRRWLEFMTAEGLWPHIAQEKLAQHI